MSPAVLAVLVFIGGLWVSAICVGLFMVYLTLFDIKKLLEQKLK